MASMELVQLSEMKADMYAAEYRLRQAVATEISDITFIFNAHLNTEHAAESVSYIEPNSVVFIEGIELHKKTDYSRVFEKDIETLNAIRIQEGIDSEVYSHFKEMLLDELNSILNSTEIDFGKVAEGTFTEHMLMSLYLLIEKDCVVHYADYSWHVGGDETHNVVYGAYSNGTYCAVPPEIDIQTPGQSIKQFYSQLNNDLIVNRIRENYALDSVVHYLGGYCLKGYLPADLYSRESGRVNTYVLYGSAHEQSLTSLFGAAGFRTRNLIQVYPMHKIEYLAIDEEDLKNTRLRRLVPHLLRRVGSLIGSDTAGSNFMSNFKEYVDMIASDDDKLLRATILYGQITIAVNRSDIDEVNKSISNILELVES